MVNKLKVSAQELRDAQMPKLRAVWELWASRLPPEAATTWRRGCAYVRESSAASLMRQASDVQLMQTLQLLAEKRVYVPWEGVFFENESGTDVGPRLQFQRLRELALAGGFEVVGVFVADRLFRNVAQALEYKRAFRVKRIDLEYFGKFQGDDRNPASWELDVMQDVMAERQARQTGFHVGMHLQTITTLGHPVGLLPEGYEVAERAPYFMGHQGSVLRWSIVEPLGSILQQGRERYMKGESYAELARWSETTELRGRTPKGHAMTAWWWRASLTNPKYAGYQMPTEYQGWKPGVENPKRPRRTKDSPLVPCKLPALWTLEDYRALIDEGQRRQGGAKKRPTYRQYLLTGVAQHEDCGHLMSIHTKDDETGHFWMVCRHLETGGRHSRMMRADVAEAELDALLGHMSFEDPTLLRQVEEELRDLERVEGAERVAFRADPAIAAVRRAIAELGAAGIDDSALRAKLAALEAADQVRRDALSAPVREFQHAASGLARWAAVWAGADMAAKNKLLREAGVRAVIGRAGEDGPGHLLSLECENRAFALALGVALARVRAFEGQEPGCASNARVLIRFEEVTAQIGRRVGIEVSDGPGLAVPRPRVAEPARNRQPRPPRRGWRQRLALPAGEPGRVLRPSEAARLAGIPAWWLYRMVSRGQVRAVRVTGGRFGRLVIPASEIDAIRAVAAVGPARRGKRTRTLDPAA